MWQSAPPQRDHSEQLKDVCGNWSFPRGDLQDSISACSQPKEKCLLVSRALTTLEMSLHFQDQIVLKDEFSLQKSCQKGLLAFPCTGHQGEERGGDGKELAEFHSIAHLVLLNERFNCRLPACH